MTAGGRDDGLIGNSESIAQLRDFIHRAGPVDSTVLLLGESGTGKELVAKALHGAGPRSAGPLVAINCATLSETLLESELFGHEKGAFTGAIGRKLGKLETAAGGTLFLDEVGELPAALQARLLRVLQERSFERVGGNRPIAVDIRVVAATNRDLEAARRAGRFRDDLFYRLDVVSTRLPPLRERSEDIGLLARHFARLHGERLGRPRIGFEPATLRLLRAYEWPGNVRQLSNVVERALVLGNGRTIRRRDLPDEIAATVRAAPRPRGKPRTAVDEIDLGDYQATITETKKRLLTTALDEAGGNAAEAGRRLGLHPNSFRRLMRQLGLRPRIVS